MAASAALCYLVCQGSAIPMAIIALFAQGWQNSLTSVLGETMSPP